MIDGLSFSTAQAADGAGIARLFAKVQRSDLLELTIWSSPLVSEFVEDIVAGDEPAFGMKFYKVTRGGDLEGAICLRNVDGRLFFDNVYVTPRIRRIQAAVPFIRHSILDYLNNFSCHECGWDVWSHDRSLIAWYTQLGGVEQYRKNWFALRLPGSPGRPGAVLGRDEASLKHARHGFSTVEVATSQRRHRAGLLGNHAFRVADDRSMADPEFLAALESIDPNRVVYVLSSSAELPGADNAVATVIRMHAPLELFLRHLERQIPRREAVR